MYGRTEQYLASLPPKWKGGTGGCVSSACAYGVEMVGLLKGLGARQLSWLFAHWNYQETTYGHSVGGGATIPGVLQIMQRYGCCQEQIWPAMPYAGLDTTTQAFSAATTSTIYTKPSAAAFQEAANFHLVDYAYLQTGGTTSGLQEAIMAAVDSEYAVIVITALPDHALCVWDYDESGVLGIDSRSYSPTPFHLAWNQVQPYGAYVIRSVAFNGPVQPIRKPSLVSTNLTLIDMAQVRLDTLRAKSGSITQGDIDNYMAVNNVMSPETLNEGDVSGISFVGTDAVTKGDWKGKYGSKGYSIVGDVTSYPSWISVTPKNVTTHTWASSTPETRALQRSGSGRIASCWYGPNPSLSPSFSIAFSDTAQHDVSFYLLDWDNVQRAMQIDAMRGNTVAATKAVSAFSGGVYVKFSLSGVSTVRFTNVGGPNAVVSGIFLD